jgi:hypothetical protein
MLKRFSFTVLPLFGFLVVSNACADTRLGDSCDLSILGVKDKSEFLRFDSALRYALDKQDAATLALLVQFPLTLNLEDGSHVSLNDSATLQLRFAEAFPPMLRKTVLAQKPEALFCRYDQGVMYGNGELWVNHIELGKVPQFRITAVNVPGSATRKAKSERAKTQIACSTDKFHIVIDADDDGTTRYRSWNKPHAPPDKPALELNGTAGGEGTGVCFHRNWNFKNSDVEYVVTENKGCGDGSHSADALAQLEVLLGGKPQLTSWCY